MCSIKITREDIGGLFRTKGGDIVRVVYIHPETKNYEQPVVATFFDSGNAHNFYVNGQFFRRKGSPLDLVERILEVADFEEGVEMEKIEKAVEMAKKYASSGEYEYSRAFEKIAWEQALTDIALGATNAQELAREALKTKSIKFAGKGL